MTACRRDALFCLLVAAACLGLALLDLGGIPRAPVGIHCRGLVTGVDNSRVRTHLIVRTEAQVLTVRLLGGPHKGAELTVVNQLTGSLELDEFYAEGAVILVEYDAPEGTPRQGLARGHYRLRLQLFLMGLFGVLLVAVAGVTGLKALLSFVFAALVLWRLFLPLLLRGWPPVLTGLVLTALLTAVITLSVGGLNRRGAATFAGSMLGVLLTCLLAAVFTHAFRLHGGLRPYAETLLYAGFPHLPLTGIFVASVFVAASGAVMDLAMDVAASMDEIARQQPGIGFREHVRGGLRVGRAVIGTNTTTLLLAYSGSHVSMLMVFMAKGLPAANLLNAPFVSAEILNTLVGSFGLVTVAPFTALAAGVLYRAGRGRDEGRRQAEHAGEERPGSAPAAE